jgi:tRNA (guanine37-N1)-methyltransferase
MKGNLKTLLAEKLKPEELKLVYKSYDVIGDVAIIRVPPNLEQYSSIIAEAIMQTHKNVKSVWRQSSPVSGDFRLRQLEFVSGERKTETIYKEHGCIFRVDLAKCYFSPRLAFERIRIARLVQPEEVVVNMFAGVGTFSIIIAKHSKASKIYSIDINPIAVKYMEENIKRNKVDKQVIPICGEAKKVIEEKLRNIANRVLMPLPEKAYEFLDVALMSLQKGLGWIHYYAFEHAQKHENPIEKAKIRVAEKLNKMNIDFNMPFSRIVRNTGPNWYQVALDLRISN